MPDRLRLAAFDLDGTLIDSAGSIVDGVMACWEACDFPPPDREHVRRIIGLPWEDSVETLLPGAGEPEFDRIKAYNDEVARGERARPERREDLFPGVIEALGGLDSAGYLLAIITSRSTRRLVELLGEHGISDRFISLKTTDNGPGKPNPYLMDRTLAENGVEARHAVMIGDTTYDMLMARGAGTAAVGVSWGVHESDELREAGAHDVVHRFDELPAVIDRLTGG